ncbi:hypothetical protein L3X38_032903 [Prunus dulcis]|uniref:Uncharacterized protein n=1 Tax=Prunus dulcis TaxID=3755 RepID=A0AAD4YWD0_PRUDU|nr:hypothetical protein L3X38_032903 [Prunus dulcis]
MKLNILLTMMMYKKSLTNFLPPKLLPCQNQSVLLRPTRQMTLSINGVNASSVIRSMIVIILKDKIQELLNNGGLEIDSSSRLQSATANMIKEKLTPTAALLDGVKFASIHACSKAPLSSDLQIPTLHELMATPNLDIWEDASVDESAEGWKTFAKRANHMAKHFPPNHRFTTRLGVQIRGMPSLKNKRKKKRVQNKFQIPHEDEYELSQGSLSHSLSFCQLSSSRVNLKLRKKLFNATWFMWRNMRLTQKLIRLPYALVETSHLLIKLNKMRKLIPLKPRRRQMRKRLRSPYQKRLLQGKFHRPPQNQRTLSPITGSTNLGKKPWALLHYKMEIGDLYSDALFHVIDVDTSYNIVLGCPWLHTYGLVPSTLYQCFKYLVDGEVKSVSADMDLFRGEEVNYSDAKFYGPLGLSFIQSSNFDKENKGATVEARKSQKVEAPKPLRVIRVKLTPRGASSSKGEEVLSSKDPKPKIIVKTSKKEPSVKEISSLKQTIESLTTSSNIHPLRKINSLSQG